MLLTPQPYRKTLTESEAIAIVQTHLASRYSGEKACLEIYSMFTRTWTGEYLGNGVWSVTNGISSGPYRGAWKLFERSGAVSEVVSSIFNPGC